MGKNYNLTFIATSTIIFIVSYLIISLFGENIFYYENNLHNFLIPENQPNLKEKYFLNDLSINLLVFVSLLFLIDKLFAENESFHYKIIWIIKNYCSLFLAIIYESSTGLDQTVYFYLTINNLDYYHHFGDLSKLFDLNNPTVNLLFPLKSVNFIFNNSWFAHKIFLNIIYMLILFFTIKSIKKISPDLNDSIILIYAIAFWPSLFFFTSFITKDIFVIFFISLIFYSLVSFERGKKKIVYLISIIVSIFFIYILRWWVALSIIIALTFYCANYFISKIFDKSYLFLTFLIFLTSYFIFYGDFYSNYEFDLFTRAFERIKVEHFSDKNIYSDLFINVGEKYDFFYYYPLALFKTVFNPFLNNFNNPKLYIFIIENCLLFVFLILSIKNFTTINKSTFFLLILFFILINIYIPLGYLNAGTTARYALQAKYCLLIYLILSNKKLITSIDLKLRIFFKKI